MFPVFWTKIRKSNILGPTLKTALVAWIFWLALLGNLPDGFAQSSAIPGELQAAIFAKVFNYDKTIRKPKGKYKVAIVVSDKNFADARSITNGFRKVNIETIFAKWEELSSKISDVSAVYVFGAENTKALENLCYQHKVLSVSGDPNLVEAGKVSVAIGISKGKPQIIIHLNRAKNEGQRFAAQLLKLVKVIK